MKTIPWVLSTEFEVVFVLSDCTWSSSEEEEEDEKEALTRHSDTGAVCWEPHKAWGTGSGLKAGLGDPFPALLDLWFSAHPPCLLHSSQELMHH